MRGGGDSGSRSTTAVGAAALPAWGRGLTAVGDGGDGGGGSSGIYTTCSFNSLSHRAFGGAGGGAGGVPSLVPPYCCFCGCHRGRASVRKQHTGSG